MTKYALLLHHMPKICLMTDGRSLELLGQSFVCRQSSFPAVTCCFCSPRTQRRLITCCRIIITANSQWAHVPRIHNNPSNSNHLVLLTTTNFIRIRTTTEKVKV